MLGPHTATVRRRVKCGHFMAGLMQTDADCGVPTPIEFIGIISGLDLDKGTHWGNIRVMLGLDGYTGKENGNY